MISPIAPVRFAGDRLVLLDQTQLPAREVEREYARWEDVAEAIMLAIRARVREAHGAFNLAADDPLTAAELARIGGLRLLRLPRWFLLAVAYLAVFLAKLGIGRAMDPAWLKEARGEMIISSAKARQELGWQPRCSTAAEVIKKYVEIVPKRLDPRLARFFRLAGWAARLQRPSPAQQQVSARIHLALAGPNGGDLGCCINHGRLSIEKSIPRPPTAVARLSASTLLDLLAGRADFAAAQITGKIHFEGEPTGAMFLNALVTNFRMNTTRLGPRGRLARRMAHSLAK